MFGESELEKAVETTDNYIRIRVKDPKLFKKKTFRTVWLSKKEGVKAIMGKLKNPPADKKGSMTLQAYLFLKTKFSKSEAIAWVESHKKFYEIENDDEFMKSWVKDRAVDNPPDWMLYLSAPYAEKIYTGVWYMVRSVKTKKHIEELLWFCSDMVYGIYWMSHPKEVEVATIEEEIGWDRFTWLTGLTQAEVFNLFGSSEKIYLYEMWGWERFREPMKYKKPEGLELFMKGNPEFIVEPDEDGNMPPEVKHVELDKMSIGEVLWLNATINMVADKPELKDKALKEIADAGYKIVDIDNTHKSIVGWLAQNKYAGYSINKTMVKCSNCGAEFDYDATVEAGMGYVKCPGCDLSVIQDGTAYKDDRDSDIVVY